MVLAVALFPSLGVQGLGIALACAYAVGFAAAFAHLRRRARGVGGSALASVVLRVVAASLLMLLVVLVISHGIGSGRAIRTATAVIGSVAAGGTVYVVAARLLGVTEVSALLSRLRRPRQ